MKKIALLLILILSIAAPVTFAARTTAQSIISETTLDDDPTSVEGAARVKSADKIAMWVEYDETEVGNSVSATVKVYISPDNSTWLQASFYDYDGGSTLQTSETLSTDGNYYLWFNRDLAMPYVKLEITGVNTDADDLAVVLGKIIKQE